MSGMVTRSRAFSTKALKVVNDVARQQFVISLGGSENAVLDYKTKGKHIDIIYTKVPESLQGRGIGKILAQHALAHAHQNGLSVTCKCHFVAKYYENNLDKFKGLKVKLELEN